MPRSTSTYSRSLRPSLGRLALKFDERFAHRMKTCSLPGATEDLSFWPGSPCQRQLPDSCGTHMVQILSPLPCSFGWLLMFLQPMCLAQMLLA